MCKNPKCGLNGYYIGLLLFSLSACLLNIPIIRKIANLHNIIIACRLQYLYGQHVYNIDNDDFKI